jgi:hypothetical protein
MRHSCYVKDAGAADKPPVAFLSHASEDKEGFAEPLGRELAKLGVRPWMDKWEIWPGDSLVPRLFDEGLARADAVVLIASVHSVTKPWVREELDSATVRRIETGTRLVPVRLDDAEMPAPLRHLLWINAERSPQSACETARKIADTLHGADPRPVVAPRPSYAANPVSIPGLNKTDALLLAEVIREAVSVGHLSELNWNAVMADAAEAGLDGDALMESLHALAEADYINVQINQGPSVTRLELTRLGYATGISAVVPDAEAAQRRVIAAIVNTCPGGDGVIQELAELADTGHLIVDQLLHDLEDRSLVVISRTLGDHSRLHQVSPTLSRLLA